MQQPDTRVGLRTWGIWLSAAMVYLIAVFHRTSFGVAGLAAAERFDVGPAALGAFTVLQIGVYAAMQVPTGVLVDRFGPRQVLTAALVLVGLGQVLLALAEAYWLGLLARGVLGIGDALTFVSVLRLAASHFPARRYPLIASLTGALGFVGNLAATVPLTLLLDGPGWLLTFLVAGIATLGYVLVVRVAVRDNPVGFEPLPRPRVSVRTVTEQVSQAWRTPGTRLGFWSHFTTMVGPGTLGMMWGMPFLVRDQGYTETTASGLLIVLVVGAMFGGPAIGAFISKYPRARMKLVVGYLAVASLCWAVLLGWPGPIPLALLIVVLGWISFGGPASMIAFALARDYNPLARVGTATGVANVGGFGATAMTMLFVGVLLDLTGGQFRISLLAIVAVMIFGGWRAMFWYRRTVAAVRAARMLDGHAGPTPEPAPTGG